jgi:hypothetical protein
VISVKSLRHFVLFLLHQRGTPSFLTVATLCHLSEWSANRRLRADDTLYKKGQGVFRPRG